MFTAALFAIDEMWKRPITEECIYICGERERMEYYSVFKKKKILAGHGLSTSVIPTTLEV
jgi:hypothetical protein